MNELIVASRSDPPNPDRFRELHPDRFRDLLDSGFESSSVLPQRRVADSEMTRGLIERYCDESLLSSVQQPRVSTTRSSKKKLNLYRSFLGLRTIFATSDIVSVLLSKLCMTDIINLAGACKACFLLPPIYHRLEMLSFDVETLTRSFHTTAQAIQEAGGLLSAAENKRIENLISMAVMGHRFSEKILRAQRNLLKVVCTYVQNSVSAMH